MLISTSKGSREGEEPIKQEELSCKGFHEDNCKEPRSKYWKIIWRPFNYCLKSLVISSYIIKYV